MDTALWIESNKDTFIEASDRIWQFAELGYHEVKSADFLAEILQDAGFAVQRGIAEIPTAFVASYGTEPPVIAILGEYDALPGLSQETVSHQQPVKAGGNGHGCGHNLLGVGSLAATLAVKEAIDVRDVQGTIRYYGCPAEENGSGKAFMAKAGVFDDVDLCLAWHPGTLNGIVAYNMLSNTKVKFKFHGIASHAAADPQNGRSALDAVELMNVGVNYLREHVIQEARIHYVILNGGGIAPNVVPPFAESLYMIRAPRPDQLKPIYERVVDVARGAELMTGTRMEQAVISGASNLVFNDTVADVLHRAMLQTAPPTFTDRERQFARELATTFPQGGSTAGIYAKMLGPDAKPMLDALKETLLFEGVLPNVKTDLILPGSTDVGDVSWVTPTGQITTACQAAGTPGHSWQLVAQSGMSIGHKGMLYAGQVLALTALEFMQDGELLARAQAEFAERIKETPFVPLIPNGIKPPLNPTFCAAVTERRGSPAAVDPIDLQSGP
jgi:aminobenzoyl-glutamate utilization protein B